MVSPGREIATAIASQGVDLRAAERPSADPDHLPPPNTAARESPSRLSLYVGIALVVVFVVLLFLF